MCWPDKFLCAAVGFVLCPHPFNCLHELGGLIRGFRSAQTPSARMSAALRRPAVWKWVTGTSACLRISKKKLGKKRRRLPPLFSLAALAAIGAGQEAKPLASCTQERSLKAQKQFKNSMGCVCSFNRCEVTNYIGCYASRLCKSQVVACQCLMEASLPPISDLASQLGSASSMKAFCQSDPDAPDRSSFQGHARSRKLWLPQEALGIIPGGRDVQVQPLGFTFQH